MTPQARADEREMPGPGSYTIDDGLNSKSGRKFTLLGKLSYDHEIRRDASPGPGTYEPISGLNIPSRTPIYRLPIKRLKPIQN